MMTLAVFWLPSQAQERFLLSSIAAVLLSINLVFISHKLPFMGANTPVIGNVIYDSYLLRFLPLREIYNRVYEVGEK